jgi:hypothetical protein
MGAQLNVIINVQKQHKASKSSWDAEMPAPACKSSAPFTPPRKAPISVQPSQERSSKSKESDPDEFADEDDSVYSLLSFKTLRKKLQPNWRFLGVTA